MAKKPMQARAIRTREKLMTALENLLRSREFEHIAIADIAREAGVAVGSVYSHFKDKHAFLAELLENRMALLEERLQDAEATQGAAMKELAPDLRAAMEIATKSAYDQIQTDAHIIRAIHTQARLQGTNPDEAQLTFIRKAQGLAIDFLKTYEDEIAHEDIEAAGRMMYYMLTVIFLEKALFAANSEIREIRPNDDDLIRSTADMLYLYLTQQAGSRRFEAEIPDMGIRLSRTPPDNVAAD